MLVVHEWWGLNEYVRMRVDKLAKLGYVAFALDMYGKGIWTDQASKARELTGHLQGKPIMRQRARAGLQILRKNQRVDTAKIAAFQEGVGKAGADWQMIYYGGAVHSFTNPAADKKNIDGLADNPSADSRSWKHMQLFFDEIF